MNGSCFDLWWTTDSREFGIAYLVLGILAFIIHILFWFQVASHRSVQQMSMLWVYNYLFTDLLLLIQLFIEYAVHSLPNCVSRNVFAFNCILEAFTGIYLAILEAYMLVCLNVSRYLLIVKNYDVSIRFPRLLVAFNFFLYSFGMGFYLVQSRLIASISVHEHYNIFSCHLLYKGEGAAVGNIALVLLIPIGLNIIFVVLTTIHVRKSQQAARSRVR